MQTSAPAPSVARGLMDYLNDEREQSGPQIRKTARPIGPVSTTNANHNDLLRKPLRVAMKTAGISQTINAVN